MQDGRRDDEPTLGEAYEAGEAWGRGETWVTPARYLVSQAHEQAFSLGIGDGRAGARRQLRRSA